MAKPPSHIDWTDGDSSKVLDPGSSKKLLGWQANERPPFRFMNWLFWRIDAWLKYFEETTDALQFSIPTYDAYIGTGGMATHSSIQAAINDPNFPVGGRMLVLENYTVDTTIQITKNDVEIQFKSGVTYSKGTASDGIQISASGVKILYGRFINFNPGRAIVIDSGKNYVTVFNARFANNETDIDDLSLTATVLGTIVES